MNIVILNGAPDGGRGATLRKLASAIVSEAGARNWTAWLFDLEAMDIKPCRGCFACWLKHPGICAIQDDEEPILRAVASSDVLLWMTPLAFGGYGPALKKSLDRIIPVLLPFFHVINGELHHPLRYPRKRALMVIGTQAKPDKEAEGIFHRLVRRNAVNLNSVKTDSRIYSDGADPAGWAGDIAGWLEQAKEAVL